MVYKSGQIFFPFCHNSRVWQTDGQTDRRTNGRTDRILIARPRLHYMQRGNKTYYNRKIEKSFVIELCSMGTQTWSPCLLLSGLFDEFQDEPFTALPVIAYMSWGPTGNRPLYVTTEWVPLCHRKLLACIFVQFREGKSANPALVLAFTVKYQYYICPILFDFRSQLKYVTTSPYIGLKLHQNLASIVCIWCRLFSYITCNNIDLKVRV